MFTAQIGVSVSAAEEPATTDDEAERALERTLVATGALLLPAGLGEIAPSLFYVRNEQTTPTLFTNSSGQFIAEQEVNSDTLDAVLQLRYGLPADMQLEFDLPYQHVSEEQVTSVLYQPVAQTDSDSSGLGDVRIGIAKTLSLEHGWQPNLVARLIWDTDSGESSSAGALGGFGYNEAKFSLTGTQRQDPLVFLWNASYQKAFESDGVKPGDEVGISLGTVLAASPETSLRVILDQTFVDDVELNGVEQSGSDASIGTLTFGAASIIGAGKFLDFAVQTGLTDDAPSYAVGVTLTLRF
ncbi:MAG: transporter [Gammaproteobacteria bacterium]|nr:transporter [Gammaproteobacteria bacterium]